MKEGDEMQKKMSTGNVKEYEELYGDKIMNPFDPTKIDITMKPLTVDLLTKRIRENEINLKTDFQRKAGLWDNARASRLIESLLIRIPLPAFYFDGSNDEYWLVVDGLQRLTTIKDFIVDKKMKLKGLEFLIQYEGLTFDQLPRPMQRRIEETQITAYVINPGTPINVKYNIFKRINTGGLVLSPQEIRHALFQGRATDFLNKLAASKEFKIATLGSIKKERMVDREYVLRFLAFQIFHFENYIPMDEFLNEAMEVLNSCSEVRLNDLERLFYKSMTAANYLFGKHAFRKINFFDSSRKNPINKSLFDTWSFNLAMLNDSEIEQLIDRKEELLVNYSHLLSSQTFDSTISFSTGSFQKVYNRFMSIQNLLRDVLE